MAANFKARPRQVLGALGVVEQPTNAPIGQEILQCVLARCGQVQQTPAAGAALGQRQRPGRVRIIWSMSRRCGFVVLHAAQYLDNGGLFGYGSIA